jgi:SGNH hydrolase-like domain, acetyltransferase AlgX
VGIGAFMVSDGVPISGFVRLQNVFRILGFFAILVVCIEVTLQGFYYAAAGDFLFRRVALPLYAPEPYAGYGNQPDLSFDHRTNEFRAHYYVNQAGFRVPRLDVEYTFAKPSNTYRIILLGPSFAYGWGVDYERSFAGLLPQLLKERAFADSKEIELINAGIPGMPMAPQVVWFEAVGRRYAPDLVIQFVYGSVAISSSSHPSVAVDDESYLVAKGVPSGLWWRERLKKSAAVFYGWLLLSMFDRSFSHPDGQSNAVLGAGREMLAHRTPFSPTNQSVRESLHVYNKLARLTNAAGARLLVVFLPLSYAIHREDESRWRHLGMRDVEHEAAFDAAFVNYLNGHGIPSIDITQQLRTAAETGTRMYFWLDIHWTPAGHAVAARAVADYLAARSIVTAPSY